ncbi:MAG: hypothetical protein J6B24_02985 [Clostridia bacterium]|nr:hypothetical protein [Clostridia bacterium]
MRSYRLFPCLIALLFCLSACSPAPGDPFAYAAAPFSISVEGTYLPANDPHGAPRPFAATVTAGVPIGGDPALRDLTVTFTAPPSLCGVTVTATLSPAADGTVGRSVVFAYPSDYGEIKVTAKGSEFDGLLRFAEALLPIGDAVEVSPVGEDGSFTVTRRGGDGTREANFTFAEGKTFPMRVILTDERGRVDVGIVG